MADTPTCLPEPDGTPDPDRRRIELSIEVPGSPEEVWEAIATGPGISSWYVPHTVEERQGGAATASFGPGPEMQVPGRVHVWEPPHRVVFAGDSLEAGLAFEWLVEARDQGSCVVRLVNSGFGDGMPWDEQYDDMYDGWKLFLRNLWLHRTYFAGRHAHAALPMGTWPGPRDTAWRRLLAALGLPADIRPGQRIATSGADVPALAGTVVDAGLGRLAMVLEHPAPGTAFLACEGLTESCGVSIWAYLYGPDAAVAAREHEARAARFLTARRD